MEFEEVSKDLHLLIRVELEDVVVVQDDIGVGGFVIVHGVMFGFVRCCGG